MRYGFRRRPRDKRIYKSDRWRNQVRPAIIERDGGRCRNCNSDLFPEVDHIIPIASGGEPWDYSNLQTLCRYCHGVKTGKEKGGKIESSEEKEWRLHRKALARGMI